ncbi:MAG: hypothetical protein LBD42_03595 [Desulfovibrio sp.]|nr:hypothetical protein [Desulfovibrio sp.]
MLDDALLGALEEKVLQIFPAGIRFHPRKEPAPWKQWNDIAIEESTNEAQRNITATEPISKNENP